MVKEKLRELDLNLLVVLESLLRCESVSQAAEDLQMSQSAVSHALKRLRELFGDVLFVRARDGMAPTPKAVEISGYVAEIIRLARITLLPNKTFDPGKSDRTLALALGDAGDMAILPALAGHMRATGASGKIVSLAYSAEEAITALGNGKLDLYVGTINTASSDIFCQKLYEDRLVVLASQKHHIKKTISFEQYANAEHIMLQSRVKSHAGSAVASLFEKEGMLRKVRIETPHIASIPMVLEKDKDLVATMPMSLAIYYRRTAPLRIIEPTFFLPNVVISQYWHRRFNNDPFVLWIRRTMCDMFQNREIAPL